MADHLVVIAAGRMVADESLAAFVARSTRNDVLVRCADPSALLAALGSEGVLAVPRASTGSPSRPRTPTAWATSPSGRGWPSASSPRRTASLEDAFLELTSDQQQFRTGDVA